MTNSPIWGHAPTEPIITKFGVRGLVGDVITGDKFCRDRLRGFRSVGVRKWGSPIDLSCRPYNRSALPCCLWCIEWTDVWLIDRSKQQADRQTGDLSTGPTSLSTTPVYQSLDTSIPGVVVYDHITRSADVASRNRDPQLTSTNHYENVDAVLYSN